MMLYFIIIMCVLVIFWLVLDLASAKKSSDKTISGILAILFACLATYIAGWLL